MAYDIRVQRRPDDDRELTAHIRLIRGLSEKHKPWWQGRDKQPPLTSRAHLNGIWTEDEIGDVMDLIKSGYSRGEIAKAYGVTRNCICGVVFRERMKDLDK